MLQIGKDVTAAAQFGGGSPSFQIEQAKSFLSDFNQRLDTWFGTHFDLCELRDRTNRTAPDPVSVKPTTSWRIAQAFCDHVRLCVNSVAVNLIGSLPPTNENIDLGRYVVLAEQAALSVTGLLAESVATGWLLGYTGEVSVAEGYHKIDFCSTPI